MGVKVEWVKGKMILRNANSGEFAGQVGNGKENSPTAQIKDLIMTVADAKSMAIESNQLEAYDIYYKKKAQLDSLLSTQNIK